MLNAEIVALIKNLPISIGADGATTTIGNLDKRTRRFMVEALYESEEYLFRGHDWTSSLSFSHSRERLDPTGRKELVGNAGKSLENALNMLDLLQKTYGRFVV